MTICPLCRLELATTTHHFLPRATWTRKDVRARIKAKEVNPYRKTRLCHDCHTQVHTSIPHARLVDEYTSVEHYRDHPEIRSHLRAKARFLRAHHLARWPDPADVTPEDPLPFPSLADAAAG